MIIHRLLTLIDREKNHLGATFMFDVKEIEKRALSRAEKIIAERRYKHRKMYWFYLLIGVFTAASVLIFILYMSGLITPDNTVSIPDGSIPLAGDR